VKIVVCLEPEMNQQTGYVKLSDLKWEKKNCASLPPGSTCGRHPHLDARFLVLGQCHPCSDGVTQMDSSRSTAIVTGGDLSSVDC
jgi:hypothetical protein